jgi:CRISPR-associated endonuclease/helicase Cas3
MTHGNGQCIPISTWHLWAKGGPKNSGDPYHPLICHLIDVANVAERLWADCIPESAQQWFAEQIGVDRSNAARWAAFWAGSHDIGKASPAFQERAAFLTAVPHGTISTVILRERLASAPFALDPELADRIAIVVGGHHGVFPGVLDVNNAADQRKQIGSGAWKSHREWLLTQTVALLGVGQLPPPTHLTNAGALWLAGFISVADWIGSNDAFFAYAATVGQLPHDFSVDQYGAHAQECAARADRPRVGSMAARNPASNLSRTFPVLCQ